MEHCHRRHRGQHSPRLGLSSQTSSGVGRRHRGEPAGAGLGRAGERLTVDADDAEARPVAERPLEIVEQRPVGVAPHVDPVGDRVENARQRLAHVVDPLLVVGRADAVLGDQQVGRTAGVLPRAPEAVPQRGRVELVAHVEDGYALLVAGPAVGPDEHARVDLHAEEVVPLGGVEEDILGVVPDALELLVAARGQLVVGHGEGQSDGHVWCGGADGVDGDAVGISQALAHRAGQRDVGLPRREHPGMPAHGGHDVGLVDCAGAA